MYYAMETLDVSVLARKYNLRVLADYTLAWN